MSLHQILKDPECKGNIQCTMWAVVFVFGWLCVLVYGCVWMSTAEKISADVYGAKNLQFWLKNHVHPETNKGFTGKAVAEDL